MNKLKAMRTTESENPTPNELYEAAVLIEDMAAIASIVVDAQASENELRSALHGIGEVLNMAGSLLTVGLDECGGTFAEIVKAGKGVA